MAGTKKPNGLTVERTGLRFIFTWKVADDDYGGGQQFQWRWANLKQWSSWRPIDISSTATNKSIAIDPAEYYPNTNRFITEIGFRVRGKRADRTVDGKLIKYDWSGWGEATFHIMAPWQPVLTAELDSQNYNITTFSWETKDENDDIRPFIDAEFQSVLAKNSNVTDGSRLSWKTTALGWQTGITAANASRTIQEDTELLSSNSYTRWLRVRARGPGAYGGKYVGASFWRYAKHVYAKPFVPKIDKVTAKVTNNATNLTVLWTAPADAAHPIDTTALEYCIATPAAGWKCPTGATWTEAAAAGDTGGKDGASVTVDDVPGTDECMWVRVVAKHDDYFSTPSAPKFAVKGTMPAPTGLNVVVDSATHRATVNATNNSDIPDSYLLVLFKATKISQVKIGVIPHGSTSVTLQCPDWTGQSAVSFGVRAIQGPYDTKTRADGVTVITDTGNMWSAALWDGGDVPIAPSSVKAKLADIPGEVILTWNWDWQKADMAEISWSQNPNAWESTDEPDSYLINNTHTAQWRVSGLATGVTWYFRVRLASSSDNSDELSYGPYSDIVEADLSSAPNVPVLSLSSAVVSKGGALTASWGYVSTDGTAQAQAELRNATVSGETVTIGTVITRVTTAQRVDIKTSNWTTGQEYPIVVRVTSGSGVKSGWSDPVTVYVATPVTCAISATSLENVTLTEDGQTRTVKALTEMPFTATITGAGVSGTTTLAIERAADYFIDRPDEDVFHGYEGETIALYQQTGEAEITIGAEDLIGILDDGALYKMIATVEDTYGQSASKELTFSVHWTEQALVPSGTVSIEDAAAVITPVPPDGASQTAVCDVYRLSADKPVKVLDSAEFGTVYVDPYPAIGGGYRFVYRTANNDYITADNHMAWVDVECGMESAQNIIDFDGETIGLTYNMEVSHNWGKAFKETRYLGGAIQGDWNPGVSRTASIGATSVVTEDAEVIAAMRRLAAYAGICHVRTVDGSSFDADVQVSEKRSYSTAGKLVEFDLAITRVDPEGYDGLPYDEWVVS